DPAGHQPAGVRRARRRRGHGVLESGRPVVVGHDPGPGRVLVDVPQVGAGQRLDDVLAHLQVGTDTDGHLGRVALLRLDDGRGVVVCRALARHALDGQLVLKDLAVAGTQVQPVDLTQLARAGVLDGDDLVGAPAGLHLAEVVVRGCRRRPRAPGVVVLRPGHGRRV